MACEDSAALRGSAATLPDVAFLTPDFDVLPKVGDRTCSDD